MKYELTDYDKGLIDLAHLSEDGFGKALAALLDRLTAPADAASAAIRDDATELTLTEWQWEMLDTMQCADINIGEFTAKESEHLAEMKQLVTIGLVYRYVEGVPFWTFSHACKLSVLVKDELDKRDAAEALLPPGSANKPAPTQSDADVASAAAFEQAMSQPISAEDMAQSNADTMGALIEATRYMATAEAQNAAPVSFPEQMRLKAEAEWAADTRNPTNAAPVAHATYTHERGFVPAPKPVKLTAVMVDALKVLSANQYVTRPSWKGGRFLGRAGRVTGPTADALVKRSLASILVIKTQLGQRDQLVISDAGLAALAQASK